VNTATTPPIGILLIGHTPFASALMGCASHVFGSEPESMMVLDVSPDCDPAAVVRTAERAVLALDQGRGVLVLTDLFGATPGNIAAQLAKSGRVEVLTGVSLPMLLRVLTYRNAATLEGLIEKATAGATAGVMKIASSAPHQQQGTLAETGKSADQTPNQDGAENALARLRDQQ
jgi:PTS system mannose-specific IIA component